MAYYLFPEEIDLSIDEKKWLFKYKNKDIDSSGNTNWNIWCKYCHDEAFTQRHLLYCKYLQRENEIVSCNDQFNGDMKEQQNNISRLF